MVDLSSRVWVHACIDYTGTSATVLGSYRLWVWMTMGHKFSAEQVVSTHDLQPCSQRYVFAGTTNESMRVRLCQMLLKLKPH